MSNENKNKQFGFVKVEALGRATDKPKIVELNSGRKKASFRIATNNGSQAEFFNVVAFGDVVEGLASIEKGKAVRVEGYLHYRDFTRKDGSQGREYYILAFNLAVKAKPVSEQPGQNSTAQPPAQVRQQQPAPQPAQPQPVARQVARRPAFD